MSRSVSMPSERGGGPGMARFLLARRIRTPCSLRRRIAAGSVVEVEAGDEAEVIGIKGRPAGTVGTSTRIEIATRGVDRRRADGEGSKMTGIAGILGILTQPGMPVTIATFVKGKQESAS